jgi:hypothetical protein
VTHLKIGVLRTLSFAVVLAGTLGVQAHAQSSYSLTWDDFSQGFNTSGPLTKWFYFAAGPFVGNDGVVSTSSKGLYVAAPGVNTVTGKPAFTLTVGQEGGPENPFSLPGGFDHVKWLAYAAHGASSGYPGFDAVPGQELKFDTWIGGQSYGNEFNPFGNAVSDPQDDVRLAAPAMNTIDLETYLVSDFFMTNKRIYALYERLPFGRTPDDNYAAFTYAIPVGTRKPGQMQHLAIAYNRSAGTMRWLIDDVEVFRVDHLGFRLPSRQYMILDHGGTEETVVCRQRDVGMGTFTLLDGGTPSQQALVQLTTSPSFYFSTTTGQPTAQTFLDLYSTHLSRIWGEGADLSVKKVMVSSR